MGAKIVSLFMTIITFFMNLFGLGNINQKTVSYKDLPYGTHPRQTVDLYLPKDAAGDTGLILSIHGGAWVSGDKADFGSSIADYCARHGFATAAMNYRYLSDTVDMDDILDDIGAALATLRSFAAEKGVTLSRVLLTGVSAGAHLSLLYAYSRADSAPVTPAAVVGYCGPTDLADPNFYNGYLSDMPVDTINQLMSYTTGSEVTIANLTNDAVQAALKKNSPLYYVNGNTVPKVLGHGKKDTIVPYSNALSLDAALTAAGVRHDFVSYPNSGHDLSRDPDCAARMSDLLLEYATTYIG